MNCDTASFEWTLATYVGHFLLIGVSVVTLVQTYIIESDKIRTKKLYGFLCQVNELNSELEEYRSELQEKLGRVYNSFEMFKSELVELEKYNILPHLVPVPPPAERTETYFDNNSIPGGPSEYEKVD